MTNFIVIWVLPKSPLWTFLHFYRNRYITRILTVFLVFFVPQQLWSCPAQIFFDASLLKGEAIARSSLKLYLYTPASSQAPHSWQSLPLQVDPMSEDGKLLFFPDENWRKQGLTPMDRLAFGVDRWGDRWFNRKEPPCRGAQKVWELTYAGSQESYLYLASCPEESTGHTINPVQRDTQAGQVFSDLYRYRHDPRNQLLFEKIELRHPGRGDLLLGFDADQFIRADVKNFFTMTFDADNVEARLEHERAGSMGMMSDLSFFLRIMFFKINLHLAPEIHFFPDAIYMPMVVYLPVDAPDHLHPGSGLYYTWKTTPGVRWDLSQSDIPLLDPHHVKDLQKVRQVGLSFCRGDRCEYSLVGDVPGEGSFVILFRLPREMVARGFYPRYFQDAAATAQTLGWEVSSKTSSGRSGLFFESSGLAKGGHNWDFWIRFGKSRDEVMQLCRREVKITRSMAPGRPLRP